MLRAGFHNRDGKTARPATSGRAASYARDIGAGGAHGAMGGRVGVFSWERRPHRRERLARCATAILDRRLAGRAFGGWRLEHVLGCGRFATTFAARWEGTPGTAAACDARAGMPLRGGQSCSDSRCPHRPFIVGKGDARAGGKSRRAEGAADCATPSDAPARAALKLIKPRAGRIDLGAVWGECAALSLCSHPGIPRWLGIVNDYGRYFIAESLMPGVSLERELARGRAFDDAEIAAVGHGLADIVARLAARGVAHGDIRPANVLVADGISAGGGSDGAAADGSASVDGPIRVAACGAASDGGISADDGSDGGMRGASALSGVVSGGTPDGSACGSLRVSLVDFGLATRLDRARACGLHPAVADDIAGIAEVVLFMLYSDSARLRKGAAYDTPWHEALALPEACRAWLWDAFFSPQAFGDANGALARFDAAFGL